MAFIPYSSGIKSEPAITVDKMGRIYLNAALRKKLGCNDKEIEMYLFFEPETRRIGIAKEGPSNYKPFKFDNRSYTQAQDFLNENDIEYRQGAVRYVYDGKFNGILAFRASQESKRISLTFRAEKNGNLERV